MTPKRVRKWIITSVFIILELALIFIFIRLLRKTPVPEGAVLAREIVSYCIGDATSDGADELLLISGDGKIDTGERYGELLLVCDASAFADLESRGYIPPEKIQHSIELSEKCPMKVQLGDINGDGVSEISICVYKTATFHPVMAKRPFFFDLVEGNLIPVWLGSRLSRPFDDYILYDIDADSISEIISIERLELDSRVVAAYNWKGFGFEILAQSEAFDGELRFTESTDDCVGVELRDRAGARSQLRFALRDEQLITERG
ncbi:MAG: hypothetical protein LBH17_06950 [Oscillospiraceae bacterium]|nr:hypothetical protein [Oscillospiraceae bacterium]